MTVLIVLTLSDWSGKRDLEIREGEVLNSDCSVLPSRKEHLRYSTRSLNNNILPLPGVTSQGIANWTGACKVVGKTLTPSPWTTPWTTHMDFPELDYAAEV